MLSWNVFYGDFNNRDIETYDIFDHWSFRLDCQKLLKKYDKVFKKDGTFDRETFAEELRRDLMYYFWSKCEWEIILSHWPPSDRHREMKIDVFDQVRLNYDVFVDYVWSNRKELLKWKPN